MLIVTWVGHWLGVVLPIVGALKYVRWEWIDCNEGVECTQLILLLNVGDVLHCLRQIFHVISWILSNWLTRVGHTEHLQSFGVVGLLISDLVFLAKYELLVKEVLQSLLLAALLQDVPRLLSEWLGENWVVPDILGLWHLDLIRWDLLLGVFNDIVHLKLQPLLKLKIEYDIVSKM